MSVNTPKRLQYHEQSERNCVKLINIEKRISSDLRGTWENAKGDEANSHRQEANKFLKERVPFEADTLNSLFLSWLAFSRIPFQHGFSLQCKTHHFSQEIGLDSTFSLFAHIVIYLDQGEK